MSQVQLKQTVAGNPYKSPWQMRPRCDHDDLKTLHLFAVLQAKYAEAIMYYQQGMRIAIKKYGQNHTITPTIQLNLDQVEALVRNPETKKPKPRKAFGNF